jgi:hypothetical protein
MTTKDRLATAQWVVERNLAWIAAADAKVAIVVALNTAMLGDLAGAFGWADASRTLWAYLLSSASAVLTSGGCGRILGLVRPQFQDDAGTRSDFGHPARA